MIEGLIGFVVGVVAMGVFYIYKRGKFIEMLDDAVRIVDVLEDQLEDIYNRLVVKQVEIADEKEHSEALQQELFEAAEPKGLFSAVRK